MMDDFISSFEGERASKGLTFVKGGTEGGKSESKDRGQLYQPTSRYPSKETSPYKEDHYQRSPSPNYRKKRRAIDELKEELSLYVCSFLFININDLHLIRNKLKKSKKLFTSRE